MNPQRIASQTQPQKSIRQQRPYILHSHDTVH